MSPVCSGGCCGLAGAFRLEIAESVLAIASDEPVSCFVPGE